MKPDPSAPPSYDQSQIDAWWNSLTLEQQQEVTDTYNKLQQDQRNAVTKAVQTSQRNPQVQPIDTYPESSDVYVSSSPIFYNYYTMYWLAHNSTNLLWLNFQINKAVMDSVIFAGGKMLHAAITGSHLAAEGALFAGKKIIGTGKDLIKSAGGGGGGGGDDLGILVVIALVIAFLIAAAAAVATAVAFAGYALKKVYKSICNICQFKKLGSSVLRIGAAGSGAFLGAVKGALVGAAIGSAIPVIGTAIGAILGATIGACVTMGLFVGITKYFSQAVTRLKVKMGLYGNENDLISKTNPEKYILTEKHTKLIAQENSITVDAVNTADVIEMMRAVKNQKGDISKWKLLPATDSSKKNDDFNILLKAIKTGKATISSSAYQAGATLFTWNTAGKKWNAEPVDESRSRLLSNPR